MIPSALTASSLCLEVFETTKLAIRAWSVVINGLVTALDTSVCPAA